MYMKSFFFYLFFASLLSTSTTCFEENLVQISIPKCGTHFLKLIIARLTKKKPFEWRRVKDLKLFHIIPSFRVKKFSSLGASQFWRTHLYYSDVNYQILYKNNCRICFIYRDPRDYVVSAAYYFKDKKNKKELDDLSIAECMNYFIVGDSSYECGCMSGLMNLYSNMMPWTKHSNVFAIRFEDIIGTPGGGNNEKQLEVMRNLAKHLEVQYNDKELTTIANDVFGKGNTFRKGCIGDWKKHFTPEHKELFKEVAGQLLIDLGYEQDFNW